MLINMLLALMSGKEVGFQMILGFSPIWIEARGNWNSKTPALAQYELPRSFSPG
jgi:hypothetical protein